jgi:uncharacterized protein (TIGR03067 family)
MRPGFSARSMNHSPSLATETHPMRKTYALLLASLALGFAPVPPYRPKANQAGLKAIQGEWVRARHTISGRAASPAAATLVIAGDRLSYGQAPVPGQPSWQIKLDERRGPKVLDREWVVPGSMLGECWRGIYTVEGDTLTLCSVVGWSEAARPADFSGKETGHIVEVFKRRKR